MNYINKQISNLDSIFPWVRKRALNNLVEIGLPAVQEIIVALDTRFAPYFPEGFDPSRDSFSEVKSASKRYPLLLDILVKIGKPAIAELENALHHQNLNVRVSAMTAICRIGHPSAVDLILPFLDSTKPLERAAAIYALGSTHSSRDFERIAVAMYDNDLSVKESAIIALGDFGSMDVLPKLEQIAESDKTMVEAYGRTMEHAAREAIRKIRNRNNK